MLGKKDLHSYQIRAVNHIINNRGCALYLDMGLGKTVSTLTAIEILLSNKRIEKPLIIAPKRVAESTWSDELAKWDHLSNLTISKILGKEEERIDAINATADIYIINRDNVKWLVDYKGKDWDYDMVVIDELSSFKSPKAKRFKALRSILGRLKRIVGLTGTPTPNGLLDLWSQIYLLDRGERLEKTITAYRNIYFKPGKRFNNIVYDWKPHDYSEDIINRKLSDICLSMQAKDYLELPEAIYNDIPIYLPKEILEQYRAFEREKIMELGDGSITADNAGILANKLRQFASGAMYCKKDSEEYETLHKAKIEALVELVDTSQENILIGYEFKHDLQRIKEAIPQFEIIGDGDTIRRWNDGKIKVAGGHPASMGHGLNLQRGGHQIVWFTTPWSLELYQQFNARLNRQGQTKTVGIHHLITKGTIDERVLRALGRKDNVQNSILETIKEIRRLWRDKETTERG